MADENPQRTEVDEQALARILRCDPVAIRRYVRLGIIKRESNKRFALFQAIGQVVEYLRGMASNQNQGAAMKAGAALKNTQRQIAEVKLAKLHGELVSLPECEALWGDLAAATKWLFLNLPARARLQFSLTPEMEGDLSQLCQTMLREVAFNGQLQLPGKGEEKDEEEEDEPEPVLKEGLEDEPA